MRFWIAGSKPNVDVQPEPLASSNDVNMGSTHQKETSIKMMQICASGKPIFVGNDNFQNRQMKD